MNFLPICIYILLLALPQLSFSQHQRTFSASDIKMGIDKLNTLGSVLYFAAHPDDENTRLIAWLAKEKLYRTGYLSLTRGDGGQNLIGTEQADELGLLRTHELLAARQIDGGEQFFSRATDFGFSKTPEETLTFWGKEEILADAVWVIRNFRPDVIISRFPPDPRGGHGHHQAAALLAIAAFDAAADPNRFPEQLEHVSVWQARRLLWNTANFGNNNTTSPDQFNIDIGAFNPLLGRSYGEIAAESRSSHKTQGFGAPRQRGEIKEYFETFAGEAPKTSLFDGVMTTWDRVEGASHIAGLIEILNNNFDISAPERSIGGLLEILKEVEQLGDSYWRQIKSQEIKELILACGGIWFESNSPVAQVAVGTSFDVNTQFIVRRPNLDIRIKRLDMVTGGTVIDLEDEALGFNNMKQVAAKYTANEITQPYWLLREHGIGSFEVSDLLDIGSPLNRNAPRTLITLSVNGKLLTYERPIEYKYTDPVRGEVYQPLSIAPLVTATISQRTLVFNGDQEKELDVVFRFNGEVGQVATAIPVVPNGWKVYPTEMSLSFSKKDEELVSRFKLTPSVSASLQDSLEFQIRFNDNRTEIARMQRTISYEHIPRLTSFPFSSIRLSKVETGISAKRVGYLPGAGDLVAESLREFGLDVTLLDEEQVVGGDLSRFDAIVTGVRFYNVNERARHMHPYLLRYVEQGGTLLVQYNVNSGLKMSDIGPYPFSLTRSRVTEEDAKVRMNPTLMPVFDFPNKITYSDFDGWIQERGLYFAENIDSRYQLPLTMSDQGEHPHNGSLLIAPLGEGKFVYTSLAFFRQLPAGVPGAYRLFINLLAKNK